MSSRQYWADAATKNCVWLLQVKLFGCAIENSEELSEYWYTHEVLLTRKEAAARRDYENSKSSNNHWRIWGVPCDGLMADLIGRHNVEFESEVEYISNSSNKQREAELRKELVRLLDGGEKK